LVLGRKKGESIKIGEDIWIHVLEDRTGHLRLGIVAPREIPVWRTELLTPQPKKEEKL
jgi:carbon storage regulator